MAAPASPVTPGDGRPAPARRPGADLPIARTIALLLLLLPIGAVFVIVNLVQAGLSQNAADTGTFNPGAMLSDATPHFLPTPVAALPAQLNADQPAPGVSNPASGASAPEERVKIANTGGAGAILRADPPKGRQVAALRDGTILQVLEHRTVDDGPDWLHVRTPEGTEGWVFSRLVAPQE